MLIRLLINALSVYLTAYLLGGVHVDDFLYAIGVALLLAIVNIVIRPILIVLTIPITVLSFGLFIFVINVLMIMLVDFMVDGFYVNNFWWALLFGIVMFFINVVLNSILGLEKKE